MSTYNEHMERFKHNKRLTEFLAEHEEYGVLSDWYVTVAFYTASQRVEAMFFVVKPKIRGRMGVITTVEHSRGHKHRNQIIKGCFDDLRDAYTTLYGYSRVAKYRCHIDISPNSKSPKALLWEIEKKCEERERPLLHGQ
jgi:hypothetical protein